MKHLIGSVLDWFKRAETRQLERISPRAPMPADLERRMREWEKSSRDVWRPFY